MEWTPLPVRGFMGWAIECLNAFPRLIPIAMATKFETKLAISWLV